MKIKYGSAFSTAVMVLLTAMAPALAEMGTIQASPGSRVNVRESPSTTARIRHYGVAGDRVNILNQTNAPDGFQWYFVEFPNSGARGWIRGDLLRLSATSAERVSFAPGTSAATVGGRVQGAESREYLVNARSGQTMTTSTISTSPFLQVLVFAPNGGTLNAGSQNWSGVLPTSGDYRIRIRLVPEEQRPGVTGEYSLTIAVR